MPSPISNAAIVSEAPKLLISPLEGEMPGRAEGGVKERGISDLTCPSSEA